MNLTLKDICVISPPLATAVPYSVNGYIIADDGTVYTLLHKHQHGIIMALLYPDLAEKAGYNPPTEESSVFEYQRFELSNAPLMPCIRISISMLGGGTNFSKGNASATLAQIQALLTVTKSLGYNGRDLIETDFGEQTVAQIIKKLSEEGPYVDATIVMKDEA